jgi:DNA-binding NarL/FixJ family response regulator
VPVGAVNAQEAPEPVCGEPDPIFLDPGLPGPGGLGLMPMLIDRAPTVPIVVLSASEDPDRIRRALQPGAAGFITKAAAGEEIRLALQAILNGDVYVPAGVLGTLNPA